MKKIITVAIMFSFIISTPLNAFAQESIGKILLRKKLEKFTPTFEFEQRHNEDTSRFQFRHYDLGIIVPIKNNWFAYANYRLVYNFNYDTKNWEQEKRSLIALQKVFKTKYAKISIRNRHEYRVKAGQTSTSRNRTKIELCSNKSYFGLKPFVSNEFFYDTDTQDTYNANRVEVGVSFLQTKNAKYSINFRNEITEDPDNKDYWTTKDAIVLKATIDV